MGIYGKADRSGLTVAAVRSAECSADSFLRSEAELRPTPDVLNDRG